MDDVTIGLNSCCHYELSCIKQKQDKIYFPYYYLEDYYIDIFDYLDIEYDIINNLVYVNEDDILWEELYLIRTESYSASVWYPYLEKYTYKSELIPINKINEIPSLLKDVKYPKFIKLDSVSCKDIHKGVFRSSIEVYDAFKKSGRILNTISQVPVSKKSHYLFVRNVDDNIKFSNEVRCFVYLSKLVAVSSNKELSLYEKSKLELFLSNIITDMPYHDAVLDIAINKDSMILIEVNNFGADSPTGAGLFNWKEDYFILYGCSRGTCYRFSK